MSLTRNLHVSETGVSLKDGWFCSWYEMACKQFSHTLTWFILGRIIDDNAVPLSLHIP
jgi:hypothetical protein